MYGEHFDVPTPDELVLSAWFQSGQIFRCGCVWRRGYGKVFYFQPGHETCPSFHNPYVQRIITNAVHWAKPVNPGYDIHDFCPHPIFNYDDVEAAGKLKKNCCRPVEQQLNIKIK